jgi:hypothetical protein
VTHDAGTDLIVPLQATNGFGWSLMDGGSVASPGTLIAAISCVYVGPTQVAVTFASAPTHAAASLPLFYPCGGMNIGPSRRCPGGSGGGRRPRWLAKLRLLVGEHRELTLLDACEATPSALA